MFADRHGRVVSIVQREPTVPAARGVPRWPRVCPARSAGADALASVRGGARSGFYVDVLSAAVTLFLVMDALGNGPRFLSALKTVPATRRRTVLFRELVLAYCVLVLFLLIGNALLHFLGLEQEAVSIAGGIVLFLIALTGDLSRSGFSVRWRTRSRAIHRPSRIPLVVGPSTIATLLLGTAHNALVHDHSAARADHDVGHHAGARPVAAEDRLSETPAETRQAGAPAERGRECRALEPAEPSMRFECEGIRWVFGRAA